MAPKYLIMELIEHGWSEQRIANYINNVWGLNVGQSSINRIKIGEQDPKFQLYRAIYQLHQQNLGVGEVTAQ